MEPLIVDPRAYDKGTALKQAVSLVEEFLDLNGYPRVKEYLWAPDDAKKPPGNNPWHGNGWYWYGTLFVNVKRSRVPVKTPGFAWSFTGSKADLTAPGILAHEIGHHVHFETDKRHPPKELMVLLRACRDEEPPVSGYEPNLHETMAEAMRLFILNPSLLKEGRPKRYAVLSHALLLKPLHDAHWREVLKHAHPRLIASLENWTKQCTSTSKTAPSS